MYKVSFRSSFVRLYNKLELDLKIEVLETVALLENRKNHERLKVHKLHGHLGKYYSCSVNYKIRIVFYFESKGELVCSFVGDHDIYR